MFTYRPHVHQLDGTITPDLIVDRLVVDGHEVPDMLSDQVVLSGCGMTCVPAVVLIAAGYGTLMGLGFVFTTADQGPARLCLIGRAAWRDLPHERRPLHLRVDLIVMDPIEVLNAGHDVRRGDQARRVEHDVVRACCDRSRSAARRSTART